MITAYNRILQKTFEEKIPFSIQWELTYKCNLSCLHCYATNRSLNNELSLQEIENCLKQLSDMGSLFITFTGGEIFYRKDLIPILRSAKKHGFAFHLFTNGTKITPITADTLAEIQPLSIEISLYSTDPAIHDRITRQKGSHAKTISAIKLCRERELNTVVKGVLLKYNINEYKKLKDYAGKVGARFVFDYMLAPADDGSQRMSQHGLSEKELYKFIIANSDKNIQLPGMPDMSMPLCGAGSNALCISPAGDVYPCLAIRQSAGNIREKTLRNIWKSSLLDKIRKSRYSNLIECRQCDSLSYCMRCAGVAQSECGNLLGKSVSACAAASATKRAIETLSRSSGNRS